MSFNALLIAGSVDADLFQAYGGDAERAFRQGFTGGDNAFIARATALALKGINRILDRVVDRTGAGKMSMSEYSVRRYTMDSSPAVYYMRSSLLYSGYFISGNASKNGSFDLAGSDALVDGFYDGLLRGNAGQGDYDKAISNFSKFINPAKDYYCGTAWTQGGQSRYVC
jgi:hypothetical protein